MWPFLVLRFLSAAGPAELNDADVARVVAANLFAVKACWAIERRAADGAEHGGKVVLALDVAPTGDVLATRVDGARFASPAFATCLRARAAAWRFPRFQHGPMRFSVPLVFVAPSLAR